MPTENVSHTIWSCKFAKRNHWLKQQDASVYQKRRGEGNQCKVGYQTVSPRKMRRALGRETHATGFTVSIPVASTSWNLFLMVCTNSFVMLMIPCSSIICNQPECLSEWILCLPSDWKVPLYELNISEHFTTKARPQHWELHALLFTISKWVLLRPLLTI